ncbi:MAG: hypothetical protein Fues2KO_19370 [Fuerstiella sp.]
MNNTPVIVRWLVQTVALAAGIAVTLLISASMQRDRAAAESRIREQFEQLPAAERSVLLEKARLLSQSPEELQRLEVIHEAVGSDPELLQKLDEFASWWQSLNREQRSELRSNGEFAADWAAKASDLYAETRQHSREIVKNFPSWSGWAPVIFTRHDFKQFLDAAIGQPLPGSLQDQLQDLDPDEQRCEIVLAKTVWLFNSIMDRSDRRFEHASQDTAQADVLRQAALDYLLQGYADEGQRSLRDFLQQKTADDRSVQVTLLFLMKEGFDHYFDIFQSKYLGNERQQIVEAFAGESRDEQLQLMRLSPEEARNALSNRLILERPTLDPGIAALADRVEQLRERFYSVLRRGSGSRSGERPPGDRSGTERPPGPRPRGDRNDERPGRPRNDDERPFDPDRRNLPPPPR